MASKIGLDEWKLPVASHSTPAACDFCSLNSILALLNPSFSDLIPFNSHPAQPPPYSTPASLNPCATPPQLLQAPSQPTPAPLHPRLSQPRHHSTSASSTPSTLNLRLPTDVACRASGLGRVKHAGCWDVCRLGVCVYNGLHIHKNTVLWRE